MTAGKSILIHDNPLHLIYLQDLETSEKPKLIKRLNSAFPGIELISQLKNEFVSSHKLDIKGLRKPIRFIETDGSYVLEMEYKDGINFRQFAKKNFHDKKLICRILASIAGILSQIHEKGWVHGSIGSSNIIINEEDFSPTLIDCTLMSKKVQQSFAQIHPEKLSRILPIISPEQTGRTNRSLDYRTDFYSFGVMAFEVLSGKLPFEEKGQMELVYAHLARTPEVPFEFANLPTGLSQIVFKLLSKNAEDRYQSASGIQHDLEFILKNWDEPEKIQFSPGSKDFTEQLLMPEKLFGREKQKAFLIENLENSIAGGRRAVFISGKSGTGKSALVQELKKPISKTKGFFLQGKFDQLARNIPYSAWIQIFQDFVNKILIGTESQIQRWKILLEQTLGNGIGVIADLIPNLNYIIQDIPQSESLNASEAQNRLNDLFSKFFKAISDDDFPMCIFIDDLQWADNASINLIKTILTDPDCDYLLLVGAFRTEALDENSPLSMAIREVEETGTNIPIMEFGNLTKEDVSQLIAESFFVDESNASKLASSIFTKTRGNPYFTRQYIKSLYDERLIVFNRVESNKVKRPVWEWDINRIDSREISTNVVELLISKIMDLPTSIIETLKSAACIGNRFHLKNLATVRGKSVDLISEFLDQAVNEGYLFYKNANQVLWVKEGIDVEYQFVHDQVQQAFYSLILENERLSTHYEIGKLLFGSLNKDQIDERIFELLFHLNCGRNFISDEKEKKWLAELNLKATREAKKINAFDSAYEYISTAHELTKDFIWDDDAELAKELGQDYVENLYVTNRFEEAEKNFDVLISKIPDKSTKAQMYYRKMIHYQHLSKIDKILDIGLEGLELLGMKFNPKTSRLKLISELIRTMLKVRKWSEDDIRQVPEMTDQASRSAMFLINKSLTFAYDRSEELMGVLGMKLVQITLDKGNHDFSSSGFSTYGGILSVGFNNHDAAIKYSKLGLDSAVKAGNKSSMAMAHFGIGMTTYAKMPFAESLKEFRKSCDIAMEIGAHADAAPSTMYFFFLNYFLGKRIAELKQIALENLSLTAQIKTDNFHLMLLTCLSVVQELKEGLDNGFQSVRGEKYSAEKLENLLNETEHNSIRIYSRIFQLHNHLLFERHEIAEQCENDVLAFKNVTLGTVLGPYFHYLRALRHGRLFHSSDTSLKRKIRKIIGKTLKMLKSLSSNNIENYEHWYFLMSAEYSRINGRITEAQKFYDKAIDVSKKRNYIHETALANYLCYKFNQETSNEKIALFYLNQAIQAYQSWGADYLVGYLSKGIRDYQQFSSSKISGSLDEDSLIKLSGLISGEIEFDKLIAKLMKVFIENAGAERAFLIMKNEGNLSLEASQVKDQALRINRKKLLNNDQHSLFDMSICQYVMRTMEAVIVDEAKTDERFNQSEYILAKSPRSILVMPLIRKGELTGLVYLENNVMSGAFQSERIRLLNFISSQIAVSIENARLYSDMITLNQAYERFVPREFLNILGKKSITEVRIGDQVQMDMTVLFADIRGFTGLSEKMNPSEIFGFINDFLSRMGPIIKKYNGFVDKYIGDEIMALFPGPAEDAIQCGIAMLHELKVFSDQLEKKGRDPLKIGIGVNTGKLMLGTVGVENRMNSTVISDAVNIASRVEKDTKITGAPFMITKETYDTLKNPSKYALRRLGKKVYRGKSTPTHIYEVFESDVAGTLKLKKANLNYFEKALEHFEQGEFKKATSLFKTILKQNPGDIPAQSFIQRINQESNPNMEYFTKR